MSTQIEHVFLRTNQAIRGIVDVCRRGRCSGLDVKMKLWNSLARSILLYSAPIWGFRNFSRLNTLKTMFLKKAMGVPSYTPNHVLFLETGQLTLGVDVLKKSLDFCGRLISMDDSRLPKVLFEFLKTHKIGWPKEMDTFCVNLGVASVSCISDEWNWFEIKQRLMQCWVDTQINVFHQKIALKQVGNSVAYISTENGWLPAEYLRGNLNFHDTRLLLQFRLNVMTLRDRCYGNSSDAWCELCNTRAVEDREHVLLQCPYYKVIRDTYIRNCNMHDLLQLKPSVQAILNFLRKATLMRKKFYCMCNI